MNLSEIAILNIKDSDYCCTVSEISNSEDINLTQNTDSTAQKEHYITWKLIFEYKSG